MGVRKRGKNYCIDFYVNGQRVREMIGPSKKQAEQVLIQRQAEILAGKYKLPQESKMTFAEAAERYLDWSKGHKRSYKDDRSFISRLMGMIGDVELGELTPWHVEQVKSQLLKRGLSRPTVNRYLAALSGVFTRASEWQLFSGENPLKKIKRYRENPSRTIYLSQEEIARLLNECSEELREVVLVALGTGMRKGEIFSLKWVDIDMENRLIHVRDSKNFAGRDIPINKIVADVFERRHGEKVGEFVFCQPDGKPWSTGMVRQWRNARKKAGLAHTRFHDLRHTFASYLAIAGKSQFALQELLGHKDLAMTRRYAHLSPGVKRDAVSVIDDLVTQSVGHNLVTTKEKRVTPINVTP